VIALEKPLEARVSLQWDKVQAARLVELMPALAGLEGTYAGKLRIQPSVDPRALGPLAIEFNLGAADGRYKAIQVGPMRVLGYADLTRFVLNDPADLPSTLQVADGLLTLWGRVSYHDLQETKGTLSSQLLVRFSELNLDQIIHAANPESDPYPGLLDGELTVIGATRANRLRPLPAGVPKPEFAEKLATALSVSGDVRLSNAKLGRMPVIADLYTIMKLGQNVQENDGRGDVQVRMENGALQLNNLHYFNMGTEVRAIITMPQVWNLPDSPIEGTAVGTPRTLGNIRLPFFAEADEVLASILANLTTVGVSGTVRDPKVVPVALSDVGKGMRNLLLGDLNAGQKAAGRR
jgi:hypothetical protein